jgi:uncharacterized protein (DUF58 family)
VAGVICYLAALLLGYDELYVFAAALLVAFAIGAAWVVVRPNLAVSREVEPQRVTRGEPALGIVTVTNRSRLPSVPAVAAEPCGATSVEVRIPRMKQGQRLSKRYRLPTDRRAVLEVGPVTITRSDPLALWRTERRQGSIETLWVHPVVHPLLGLIVGRTRSLDGESADVVPHGSITFHALREYVPGDDRRHIHWRASARAGTLMVREHVDTSVPQLVMLIDTRASRSTEGSFEELLEAAASIATLATRAGYPVRIVTTCGRSVVGRGVSGDVAMMLDFLSGLNLSASRSLRDAAAQLMLQRNGDAFVACVGRIGADDVGAIAALARRYTESVVTSIGIGDTDAVVRVPNALVIQARDAVEFANRWNAASVR